ncbi:hypothetical protein [Mariniflexile sp. AS56]|uniref:hypothetical protein n=1 Tax=Mariniflexile sp. AS56 TaxID=3063957 RepID=UPI0026EC3AA0|nr:hypothetical protein [Mariniflexile sp. AS56]MDO7172293.1 hypothetical protein [Mariniflexile sp. AS56]
MKISLIFLSTLLVLSVVIPFIIFIYNGSKNTVSIKKQAQALLANNGIDYSVKDVWRKKFMGISSDGATLTYVKFNLEAPAVVSDIDLKAIKQCHIIKNEQKGSGKSLLLKALSLELVYKTAGTPNLIINFFNLDDDLTEDFELQRIEKWHTLITNAIVQPQAVRMAS